MLALYLEWEELDDIIENETFNTLKNQGYYFEHNFGHGNKNLSILLVKLMMLAFLIDEAEEVVTP